MRTLLKSEKIRQNLGAVAAAKYFTYVTAMTYFSIGNTIGMHLSLAGMMLTAEYTFHPLRVAGILLTGQYAIILNGDRDNKHTSIYRYKGKYNQFISGNREVTPA